MFEWEFIAMEPLAPVLFQPGKPVSRRQFCAGAAALPVALATPAAQAALDFNGDIGWLGVNDGMSEAAWQSKPVFMVIHADWCPACRIYTKLFRNSAVIAKLGSFVPVLVDYDHGGVERRYRPDGGYIPRSLIFSPSGEHISDVTGPYKSRYFLPPSDAGYLLDYLNRGLSRARGTKLARAQPSRKMAPGRDGERPSFSRPQLGARSEAGSGPKRMRAPTSSTPLAEAAPDSGAAETAPVPGIVDRILNIFF